MILMIFKQSSAKLSHSSVCVILRTVSALSTKERFVLLLKCMIKKSEDCCCQALSVEKDQFEAGIKKCEKLLTILLPGNVFKIKGLEEFMLALDLEKSLLNKNDLRSRNLNKRKSESLKKQTEDDECKNVKYLSELTSKLEIQNSSRIGHKSFKNILKVLI